MSKYEGAIAHGGDRESWNTAGVDEALSASSLHEVLLASDGTSSSVVALRVAVDPSHGGLTLVEDVVSDPFAVAIQRSQMRSMLNDTARCEKYALAIEIVVKRVAAAVTPAPVRALDVGAGTGLLAMIAARAGAQVDALEMFPPLAALAAEVVADNGLTDAVTVYPAKSTDMLLDMPKDRYNILVTEIFDSALLGEGILPVLAHATESLLAPGAQVVPASAVVFAQLVESPNLFAKWHDLSVDGDFAFHRTPSAPFCNGGARLVPVQLDALSVPDDYRPLSEPFHLFSFDFASTLPPTTKADLAAGSSSTPSSSATDGKADNIIPQKRKTRVDVPVTAAGTPHAVLIWWELDLVGDGSVVYSTKEGAENWQDHWLQAVYPLPGGDGVSGSTRRAYVVGECIQLAAGHSKMDIWFSLDANCRSQRLCSCGYHSLRGGPPRINSLGDLERTQAMRARIADGLVTAETTSAAAGASLTRVLDASICSSICALMAVDAANDVVGKTNLDRDNFLQRRVCVTSLETEDLANTLGSVLSRQVADAWARDERLVVGRVGADETSGPNKSEDADTASSKPRFAIAHTWNELEASVSAHGLFDLLVFEPESYAALSGYPTALAASMWLRRAALDPLLARNVAIVPSKCSVVVQLLEFADDTLSRSFDAAGTVVGFNHARLDKLCVDATSMNAGMDFEAVSLPLYMYKTRQLSPLIRVYTFCVGDLPPNGQESRSISVSAVEKGRVDAISVSVEFDGRARERIDRVEVLWLANRQEMEANSNKCLEITCTWDRMIGGFGFCVGQT
jgi:hypothetical protein